MSEVLRMDEDFMEALKIHGYVFDENNDSDSGKSEFDEIYESAKPPPILIDSTRLVHVQNRRDVSTSNENESPQNNELSKFNGTYNRSRKTAYKPRNTRNVQSAAHIGTTRTPSAREHARERNRPSTSKTVPERLPKASNSIIAPNNLTAAQQILIPEKLVPSARSIFETESFASRELSVPSIASQAAFNEKRRQIKEAIKREREKCLLTPSEYSDFAADSSNAQFWLPKPMIPKQLENLENKKKTKRISSTASSRQPLMASEVTAPEVPQVQENFNRTANNQRTEIPNDEVEIEIAERVNGCCQCCVC